MISMACLLFAVGSAGAQGVTPQTLLPGALIPQFVDPLPGPGQITVIDATAGPGPVLYNINSEEFQAQILPSTGVPAVPAKGRNPGFAGLPADTASWVWGYLTDDDVVAGSVRPSYLGPVVLAARGVRTHPTYVNNLPNGIDSNVQYLLPIDQTLDWADPLGAGCVSLPPPLSTTCSSIYLGPQPAVPHIHGGEVAPAFDGGPDAWWTPTGVSGVGFAGTTFEYPNTQQAGTIWFHDHALGITRLNVYAGMAGVHIISDPANEPPQAAGTCSTAAPFGGCLPNAAYDIPIIIQDRSFDTTGQLFYNLASNPQPNPAVHPYWIPEFIGDTIVVNGKTWPFLNVEPRKYRLRLLNGSNARFYDLTLSNGAPFTVIATDDGYLNAPVVTPNVIIGPGERYEVIVDFAGLLTGTQIIMKNSARTPFPGGAKVVKGTTDTVMQFRVNVTLDSTIADATLPANLRPNNQIVDIKGVVPAITRQLTLNEVIGPGGPLELVLNNTKYNGVIPGFTQRDSEQPQVGATELWEIINITADAHPIHTHLASHQIVNRQGFQATKWTNVYANDLAANAVLDGQGPPWQYLIPNADGAIGGNPAIGPYLQANRLTLPLPYEAGWKDTTIMYPGEVTRIMIRWTPTDILVGDETPGTNQYEGFDPMDLINGVGYVWHCHIIDHEDNEMMRPYVVQTIPQL
ncbi:MAG: multicopper oxidase domain-containing protein [Deltaproteobacteria bacterium]|nr:multicopper oxidase domain-containing protein [Deltaproteobacteria bacterium]